MKDEKEIMELINTVFGSEMPNVPTMVTDKKMVADWYHTYHGDPWDGVFHEIPDEIKERFSDLDTEFTGIMLKPSEKGWDVTAEFVEFELDECGNEFGQSRYMKVGTIEK